MFYLSYIKHLKHNISLSRGKSNIYYLLASPLLAFIIKLFNYFFLFSSQFCGGPKNQETRGVATTPKPPAANSIENYMNFK